MNKTSKRLLAAGLSIIFTLSFPAAAFAEEYDLAQGSVEITANESGQYVSQVDAGYVNVEQTTPTIISQSDSETPTTNTVSIDASDGATAEVTLDGVNIDVSNVRVNGDPDDTLAGISVSTDEASNVVLELDGENTVTSGIRHAGVENNESNLVIQDENGTEGSLTANGGAGAAGIGGAYCSDGGNIKITGGNVTASGNTGIGGGQGGNAENITICGGTVHARGGSGAAIGGGGSNYVYGDPETYKGGSAKDITITGNAKVFVQVSMRGGGLLFNFGTPVYVSYCGPGAHIGSGGSYANNGGSTSPVAPEQQETLKGTELTPNTDGLKCTGFIKYITETYENTGYNKWKYVGDVIDSTIYGNVHDWDDGEVTTLPTTESEGVLTRHCKGVEKGCTATTEESIPKLHEEEKKPQIPYGGLHDIQNETDAVIYTVTDLEGRDIAHDEEYSDGILTITVSGNAAMLNIYSPGILISSGVEEIEFITDGLTTVLTLDEYASGARPVVLIHDGTEKTVTSGAKQT